MLTCGHLQNISENKLKAFNIGAMNLKKTVSKKGKDGDKKKVWIQSLLLLHVV